MAAAIITLSAITIRAKKYKETIVIIAMLIFGFFSPIYYGMVAKTFYLAPRIIPAVFASISITIILITYYRPKLHKNYLFTAAALSLLAINIYSCSTIITDIQITNQIEISELRTISARMKAYENESGTEITTVKVYIAGNAGLDEFDKAHINLKAALNASRNIATHDWCDVAALQRFGNKTYEREDMTEEEYKQYFNDLEPADYWTFDPDKRIKIVDNTLYWTVY
jgi:hypothetical protein